jgi:NAD-dependent deacetylase
VSAHSPNPLAARVTQATRIVAFTGAGVSTESGIPDFRSPGGFWTRYDPRQFDFDSYVEDRSVRELFWQLRREFFAVPHRPNPAHYFLAALERQGSLLGVITQNIDGLHQDAGSRNVIELHGTAREVMCLGHEPHYRSGCGWRAPYTWALERDDTDPLCPQCGGLVKSATVSFGQPMDPRVMSAAHDLVRASDLMLAIGSSLMVYPAAGLPEAARRLVIINDSATPLDHRAELVVRGRAGEVLGECAVECGLDVQPGAGEERQL